MKIGKVIWLFGYITLFSQVTSQAAPVSNEASVPGSSLIQKSTKIWTLENLAEKIAQEKSPIFSLYQIWKSSVQRLNSASLEFNKISSLDCLNVYHACSSTDYSKKFIELCQELGIDSEIVGSKSFENYDFCFQGDEWVYLDLKNGQFYLDWDNVNAVSSEKLKDDPLLVLRSKNEQMTHYRLEDSCYSLAKFLSEDSLAQEKIEALEIDEVNSTNTPPPVSLNNSLKEFFYEPVCFYLNPQDEDAIPDLIHWQISFDEEFKIIPSSLENIQNFESTLSLSLLDETFLNSRDTYYFRFKTKENEKWSEWSETFTFSVRKPERVSFVEFEESTDTKFELNWEREAEANEDIDEAIEYFVFGSNAFDFIPSIYQLPQVNLINGNRILTEESNNLIAVTTETKLPITDQFAYYRVIARIRGQFSVPSPLIHIYGKNLIQPRTQLQFVIEDGKAIIKRVLIAPTYPWTTTALPRLTTKNRVFENSLLDFELYLSNLSASRSSPSSLSTNNAIYSRPSHVPKELWEKMKPYFLPENHPWKSRIDRIFLASRASENYETLRQAGFRGKITRVRKIFAGVHPECVEVFFKIYCDSEVNMRYTEWQKWLDRIRGKDRVKAVIKKYGFEKWFSAPDKWCYPLPERPLAPKKSARYHPKDFILVCSNERPYDHYENEKLWKTTLTKEMLDALYIVLDEAGMWDSVFIFNIPFSKINGKICFVDTEYSNKWPIRYEKLSRYLSSKDRKYWEYLIKHHGPKGYKRSPL